MKQYITVDCPHSQFLISIHFNFISIFKISHLTKHVLHYYYTCHMGGLRNLYTHLPIQIFSPRARISENRSAFHLYSPIFHPCPHLFFPVMLSSPSVHFITTLHLNKCLLHLLPHSYHAHLK